MTPLPPEMRRALESSRQAIEPVRDPWALPESLKVEKIVAFQERLQMLTEMLTFATNRLMECEVMALDQGLTESQVRKAVVEIARQRWEYARPEVTVTDRTTGEVLFRRTVL